MYAYSETVYGFINFANFNCSVVSKMAVGYYPNGNVAPLYDLGWLGPAGQMYSTITDLNKVHGTWFLEHFLYIHSWQSFYIQHMSYLILSWRIALTEC